MYVPQSPTSIVHRQISACQRSALHDSGFWVETPLCTHGPVLLSSLRLRKVQYTYPRCLVYISPCASDAVRLAVRKQYAAVADSTVLLGCCATAHAIRCGEEFACSCMVSMPRIMRDSEILTMP